MRDKLTFKGFLLGLEEGGDKDSEGVFTLSTEKTVERLTEQYSGDPTLGYVELLQGMQELGSHQVELILRGSTSFGLWACFPETLPDLSTIFENPYRLLDAKNSLQSAVALLMLLHRHDRVVFSFFRQDQRPRHYRYEAREHSFVEEREFDLVLPHKCRRMRTNWLGLNITSEQSLVVHANRKESWRKTGLSKEFANRLAFYGVPLTFRGQNLQCPLPGRLVPVDSSARSPVGGMGHSWIPMAFKYFPADRHSSDYFLSEPFTGFIAPKVRLGESLLDGRSSSQKPCFVSFSKCPKAEYGAVVPFLAGWWPMGRALTVPGFRTFPRKLKNPRLEPPLFVGYASGKPLLCSKVIMLSTALKGQSTVVFVKSGTVLGAHHVDLGVPGTLCVVGMDNLTTDLSRRSVRRDESYHRMIEQLTHEVQEFYEETAQVLGFSQAG